MTIEITNQFNDDQLKWLDYLETSQKHKGSLFGPDNTCCCLGAGAIALGEEVKMNKYGQLEYHSGHFNEVTALCPDIQRRLCLLSPSGRSEIPMGKSNEMYRHKSLSGINDSHTLNISHRDIRSILMAHPWIFFENFDTKEEYLSGKHYLNLDKLPGTVTRQSYE